MLLLLDQGLPRDAAEFLREIGINCTHVGEIGMATATDSAILEWAFIHDAVIATLDADFHAMLAVSGKTKPSVIRIRIQGLKGPAAAKLLLKILARYTSELSTGCMLTVKKQKTTCRLLD